MQVRISEEIKDGPNVLVQGVWEDWVPLANVRNTVKQMLNFGYVELSDPHDIMTSRWIH